MVGGCDLTTTAEFLGGRIATDFSHVGPSGAFIHVGHTETLRQSVSGLSADQRALVDRIPFLDQQVFRSPAVVAPDYDVLVYSVLTDYTQGLYRHRRLGLIVPWHQFHHDVTDPEFRPMLETQVRARRDGPGVLRLVRRRVRVPGRHHGRPVRGEHSLAGRVHARGRQADPRSTGPRCPSTTRRSRAAISATAR